MLEKQLKPETIRAYLHDLRGLHSFVQAAQAVSIQRDDLRRYMRAMAADGAARATIRRKMQGYATYFKWLKYESIRPDVATDGLVIPKRHQREAAYLSVEQLQKFADSPIPDYKFCIPARDRAAWRLLAFLGLRRSEIINLKIEDVHLNDRQLILRDTKDGHDAALHIPDAIIPDLVAAIGERVEGYVCPGYHGGIWRGSSLSISFKNYLVSCGLDGLGITPKALRHSFGTHLALNGVVVTTINKLMRHKEIRTTMKYIHLDNDTMIAALNKLPIKDKAG